MTEDDMEEYVSSHDPSGMIVGLDPVTEEVIENASSLEIISKYGTGLDNIDLEAARKAGITVTRTIGANTQSVADLALGLLLSLVRWIPTHDRNLRNGELDRKKGREIWDKTLGIIGMGQIGTAVAKRAAGFDMEVLYTDVVRKEIQELALDVEYRDLEPLLENSDFVSLHCPLMEKTKGIIGKEELLTMDEDSFLVNTARHELVDINALEEALEKGEIAGAAIDTFDAEESLETSLLDKENFVGSPHAGASTLEATLRMAEMATDEVLRVLNGKEPSHPVKID